MTTSLPPFIRLWFLADGLLALSPPLHWATGGGEPILGVPRVLAYLFVTSAFISASVVVAYMVDPARRAG